MRDDRDRRVRLPAMSDAPKTPTQPEDSPPESAKEAKARARAEKAYAKASRPWYKKMRYILPLAALVIIGAIVATTGGDGGDEIASPDGEGEATTPDGEGEATSIGIGSPARDGNFEFTVSSFGCGETTVGDDILQEEAQGQFCIMDLTVENIGDEAQSFLADDQFIFSADDVEYSASFAATLANSAEGDEIFTEINPGNSIDGTIVFDVPEDAEVAYAELHDSVFSNGIRVELE
ncbi:MAG: DUF4352 domain-containing protein [Acidimicrobiia bacterium]|nr:DUF4352 domain-containing protein [Acidimicrobiia bacterium]